MSKLRKKNREGRILKELLNRQKAYNAVSVPNNVSFEKFVYPIVRTAYPNMIAQDLVSVQPMSSTLKAVWTMDSTYHPYSSKLDTFVKSTNFTNLGEAVKDWDERVKNVMYGYILTNPFQISSRVEVTYAYIFNAALGIKAFVESTNKYHITKEDLLKQIEKRKAAVIEDEEFDGGQEEDMRHIWRVLVELSEQNLL